MAKKKTWIISTESNRPIDEIAKDLADAGLKDVQVLQEIGSITGSSEEEAVEKMRKVRGVKDVSSDITVTIGPPDSEETW